MNIGQEIITNILNEKASIDWNNYLTPEEVKKFLSKDDKIESAKEIIYSKEFEPRYNDFHNDLQKKYNNSWTKQELIQDLVDFYNFGNLLTENFVLKGIEDDKSFDIAYNSNRDKLEKFKEEMLIGHPNIYMWIEDNKNINESNNKLWQNQISNKSEEELKKYLDKLYKRLANYNDKNKEIKSNEFYNLLDKINYIEDIIGNKPKLGRELR